MLREMDRAGLDKVRAAEIGSPERAERASESAFDAGILSLHRSDGTELLRLIEKQTVRGLLERSSCADLLDDIQLVGVSSTNKYAELRNPAALCIAARSRQRHVV